MNKMPSNNLRPRRRTRQAGFSIIEVLVGFFILLLVLIGLLPMFTRAVIQNLAGKESIVVTNHGGTQLESLVQLTFNNWEVDIPAGAVRQTIDYWSLGDEGDNGDERWLDDPGTELATWERTTEIRQFSINGVVDTDLDGVLDQVIGLEDTDHDGYFDNPLPAGTTPNAIHLKEVRVLIESQRSAFGKGDPTRITLRSLKAF